MRRIGTHSAAARHRFHALCPYFAMFPEAFVSTWLDRITKPGDLVLDPFAGRGTTPFQSLLQDRRAIAVDVNPVAVCVSRAKTNAPTRGVTLRRLAELRRAFRPEDWERARVQLPRFFRTCYHASTLRQVLFLRSSLRWAERRTDCMIAAVTLGCLHGETQKSPSYLSNQMPRTISTKPAYSVRFWEERGLRPPKRNAFDLIADVIRYRYESDPPGQRASIFHADMRDLPRIGLPEPPQHVITSPPYFNVTSFEEDQWLRLWFLGGPPHPTYRQVSRDDRHEEAGNYWSFVGDFWRSLSLVLAPQANVVVRLAAKGTRPRDLRRQLVASSKFSPRDVRLVSCETSRIRNRQTQSFRPGARGCLAEIDAHFVME